MTIERATLEAELEQAQQNGDFAAQGRLLMQLGDFAKANEEFSLAQGLYGQAWAAYAEADVSSASANSLKRLGHLLAVESDRNQRLRPLTRQIDPFANLSPGRDDALAIYNLALTLFRDVNDVQGEAQVLKAIGDLWITQFVLEDEAQAAYQQAQSFFRSIQDRYGEAETLRAIGNLPGQSSQRSIEFWRQALSLYEQQDCFKEQAEVLVTLGRLLHHLEYPPETICPLFESALTLFMKVDDVKGVTDTLEAMDILDLRPVPTRTELETLLDFYRKTNSLSHEIDALLSIGQLILKDDGLDAAMPMFQQALTSVRFIGDGHHVYLLWKIGRILDAAHEDEKALFYYEQTLALDAETFELDSDEIGDIYRAMSLMGKRRNDPDLVRMMLRKEANCYGQSFVAADILRELAEYEITLSNYEATREALDDAHDIYASEGEPYTRRLNGLWCDYADLEAAQQHDDQARLYFQMALDASHFPYSRKYGDNYPYIRNLWRRGQFEWSHGYEIQGMADCSQALTLAQQEDSQGDLNKWFPIEERQREFDTMISRMESDQ